MYSVYGTFYFIGRETEVIMDLQALQAGRVNLE